MVLVFLALAACSNLNQGKDSEENDTADVVVDKIDNDGDSYSSDVDCDDTDRDIYPGADEYCDGIDNDCDTVVDESDAVDTTTWYPDFDYDGFGRPGYPFVSCEAPLYYTDNDGDCNDDEHRANPDATEYCDGIDNDCDGVEDEEDDDAVDIDGDGFGSYAIVGIV